MTDRLDTEERYARALASTHLETKPHQSAIDILTAAGWANEGLGTMLLRLRIEWDYARATGGISGMQFQRQRAAAQVALTRHAIRMARRHASRTRMSKPELMPGVAESALDYWLDNLCPDCRGRGQHGGAGTKPDVCRTCHGSGHKTMPALANVFALTLLAEMDRKVARATERICAGLWD